MLDQHYQTRQKKINSVRTKFNRALTLTEKILYGHFYEENPIDEFKRNKDYIMLQPDRLAMQDATGQMALLQFMNTGRKNVALPASVHCDHLIIADQGREDDLKSAKQENQAVYDFLQSASRKFGLDFWKPGSGIIHQIILENYALPGNLMLGTDSHTPNCGGIGMLGIGVGGADAVDVMAGFSWELKMPKIIGIYLEGELPQSIAAKDVILYLTGLLGAKGATNAVLEYFGPGCKSISPTGRATICNMGAETGATSSLFSADETTFKFLQKTGRESAAKIVEKYKDCLKADQKVYNKPDQYYDRVVKVDLSQLEPHLNGPFTPDAAYQASQFQNIPEKTQAPAEISAALIGSCTNASYQDLKKVATILENASEQSLKLKSDLIVNPGSEAISQLCKKEGFFKIIEQAGGKIMANACGPCIGQWNRKNSPAGKNTIITSFNRNFRKRNDGNPETYAFLASPETVTILALAGRVDFNPLQDNLENEKGDKIKALQLFEGLDSITMPVIETPTSIFGRGKDHQTEIKISEKSQRVARLKPFPAHQKENLTGLKLLVKTEGKCTTDHISQAGRWLQFRGNLDKISDNLLLGANNYFYSKAGYTKNHLTQKYDSIPKVARHYKKQGVHSVIVAEDNYGEGSSREHAAMEPRYMGVESVLAKSFARIHETNLKKQGVLALTFQSQKDYEKIRENDTIDIIGLPEFAPESELQIILHHEDDAREILTMEHTYSKLQIEWFWQGSAINWISKQEEEQ